MAYIDALIAANRHEAAREICRALAARRDLSRPDRIQLALRLEQAGMIPLAISESQKASRFPVTTAEIRQRQMGHAAFLPVEYDEYLCQADLYRSIYRLQKKAGRLDDARETLRRAEQYQGALGLEDYSLPSVTSN